MRLYTLLCSNKNNWLTGNTLLYWLNCSVLYKTYKYNKENLMKSSKYLLNTISTNNHQFNSFFSVPDFFLIFVILNANFKWFLFYFLFLFLSLSLMTTQTFLKFILRTNYIFSSLPLPTSLLTLPYTPLFFPFKRAKASHVSQQSRYIKLRQDHTPPLYIKPEQGIST